MTDITLEEVCLNHLLYSGSDDKILTPYDFKILKSLGNDNSHIWCHLCIIDEHNKKCPFYNPIHLHTYNVKEKTEEKK